MLIPIGSIQETREGRSGTLKPSFCGNGVARGSATPFQFLTYRSVQRPSRTMILIVANYPFSA
jgi:hypothetical protein